MGLELLLDLASALQDTGSTQGLPKTFKDQGWQEVNFGFSLARSTSAALDIIRGHERYLLYRSTPQDRYSQDLLEAHNLPRLARAQTAIQYTPAGVSVVSVPPQTRALDSLRFPEQTAQTGYLGAHEIMVGVAKLLARIYKATSAIPLLTELNRLALITGQKDYIRLVPPLDLQPASEWAQVTNQLLSDLAKQDPEHDHQNQIRAFEQCFTAILDYDS